MSNSFHKLQDNITTIMKNNEGKLGSWILTMWLHTTDTNDKVPIGPNAIEDILVVCNYSL